MSVIYVLVVGQGRSLFLFFPEFRDDSDIVPLVWVVVFVVYFGPEDTAASATLGCTTCTPHIMEAT